MTDSFYSWHGVTTKVSAKVRTCNQHHDQSYHRQYHCDGSADADPDWSWSDLTPEVLEKMQRNLAQSGQLSPITVAADSDLNSDAEFEAIDGNVRVKALRKAGIRTVWAIIHDEINRIEALKLALQLNHLSAEKDAVNFSKALYELAQATGIEYIMTLTTKSKRDIESFVNLAAQNFDWHTYEGPRVDPETKIF